MAHPPTTMTLAHKLQGGNTDIRLSLLSNRSCSPSRRAVYVADVATFEQVAGEVRYDPDAQRVESVELRFKSVSLAPAGIERPMNEQNIDAARVFWLEAADHPQARFVSRSIRERRAGETSVLSMRHDWRHVMTGDLYLRGEVFPLEVPIRLTFTDDGVELHADLRLSRAALGLDNVAAEVGALGWRLSRSVDEMRVSLRVDRATAGQVLREDAYAMRRDYEHTVDQQQRQIDDLNEKLDWLMAREQIDHTRLGTLWSAAESRQRSDLPEKYTDRVDQFRWGGERLPRPAEFEMVLVPGDPGRGIKPFYMAATEVTWPMFEGWMYSRDININAWTLLQEIGLRPSPPYEYSPQFVGKNPRKPAMAMSYLTATSYCAWLSEQTGRTYRLPTHAEWLYALELGGGVSGDPEVLLQTARLRENFEFHHEEDVFDPFFGLEDIDRDNPDDVNNYATSSEVGSLAPNKLGLYDMLGNAAEWVSPSDGGDPRIVGGHYLLPAEDLSARWRMFENQDVWNATYPQKPVSRFWYRDFYITGLRLVCEPVNIPEGEGE